MLSISRSIGQSQLTLPIPPIPIPPTRRPPLLHPQVIYLLPLFLTLRLHHLPPNDQLALEPRIWIAYRPALTDLNQRLIRTYPKLLHKICTTDRRAPALSHRTMDKHGASSIQGFGYKVYTFLEMLQEIFIRVVVETNVQVGVVRKRAGFVDVEVEDGEDVGDACFGEEVGFLIQSVQTTDVQVTTSWYGIDPAHIELLLMVVA
jgi:hypothetical protein